MTNAKSFKRLAACLLTVVMLVSCFATMGVAAADDSIDGKVAAIRFTNLTLNGNIGLNFYFEMEEFVLADENAYVSFTVNGEETKILVKDAYQKTLDGDVNGVVYEIVTCELEPTQMTEQVMVKVVSGEKTSATYSYSIYDYATALLASVGDNADYAEAKALIEKADFVTIGYGDHDVVNFTIDQILGCANELVTDVFAFIAFAAQSLTLAMSA
jgi:hypothetical protein